MGNEAEHLVQTNPCLTPSPSNVSLAAAWALEAGSVPLMPQGTLLPGSPPTPCSPWVCPMPGASPAAAGHTSSGNLDGSLALSSPSPELGNGHTSIPMRGANLVVPRLDLNFDAHADRWSSRAAHSATGSAQNDGWASRSSG